MSKFPPRAAACLLAMASALALAAPASAQSRQVTTPNLTTAAGTVTATLGGTAFANQGLVGAGRLGANTRDFRNETLGSFSGMAIDLSSWRRNADGSYAGMIYTLPDRGPFDGAIDTNPGRFWFSVPRPYSAHDPKLGRTKLVLPQWRNSVAGPCATPSVCIE